MPMSIQDIKDEMEKLKTEEGAAQFITEVTRLPYERVLRIYRLGQPWPLRGEGQGWDFGRQAEAMGIDPFAYMAGIAPLIEMEVEQQQAKREVWEQSLSRGEIPDPIPELENPIVDKHLEKVANITNEPLEIVQEVFRGILAHLRRFSDLTGKLIEEVRVERGETR